MNREPLAMTLGMRYGISAALAVLFIEFLSAGFATNDHLND
jgi:hypothetical protein